LITKNFDVYSVELAFIAWIADFFGRCRSIVGLSLEVVKSKLSIGFCDLFLNACFALLGISTRSPALASTQCNFPLASTSTSILPERTKKISTTSWLWMGIETPEGIVPFSMHGASSPSCGPTRPPTQALVRQPLDGQQKQIAQKTAKITKGLGLNRAPTGCGTQLGEVQ
jgi:hypothetical protein